MQYQSLGKQLQQAAGDMDDAQTLAMLERYKMHPDRTAIFLAFFDEAEEFYMLSDCEGLAKLAKRSAVFRDRNNGRTAVLDHITNTGYGAIVQDLDGKKWGFVHPSVDNSPRVSFFDQRGFYAHSDCNSLAECAETAFDYGMRAIAPSDIMDKVFSQAGAR